MDVERRNILFVLERCIAKLHDLLSDQHQTAIIFDDESEEPYSPTTEVLSQLLNALECGLCHGVVCFSGTDSLLVCAIDPWTVICRATSPLVRGRSLINEVEEIDEVKTGLGKARLWLRKALMSKNLAYLLSCLIEHNDANKMPSKEPSEPSNCKGNATNPNGSQISRFYASGSLLTSVDGRRFVAALAEIDPIDFCFPIKDNLGRFDRPLHPIDYEACFRAFSTESPTATFIPL
nr:unnamed protein product [Spirometra erinaceieuropaei]